MYCMFTLTVSSGFFLKLFFVSTYGQFIWIRLNYNGDAILLINMHNIIGEDAIFFFFAD